MQSGAFIEINLHYIYNLLSTDIAHKITFSEGQCVVDDFQF